MQRNRREYFIVNTDKRYFGNSAENIMLRNREVSAFGDRAVLIERIQSSDKVFLYSNGVGIIATGIASGNIRREIDNGIDVSSIGLDQFQILDNPLTASQIKNITGVDYRYMNTVFSPTNRDGQKIWDYLNRNNLRH